MKLTGKARKDFQEWQRDNNWFENEDAFNPDYFNLELFDLLPQSMQYSVYVDFFDSVSIEICIYWGSNGGFEVQIFNGIIYETFEVFETRQEAREQAILKANEIYNLNKKQ